MISIVIVSLALLAQFIDKPEPDPPLTPESIATTLALQAIPTPHILP